ncbi:MAG: CBS domain-containing protein [Acidimicrobiia bacterium]
MDADQVRVYSLSKGPAVYARPDMNLRQLAVLLTENNIGAALVRGPHHAEGLVSERDLVRAVAEGLPLKGTRVDEIMTEDLVTVHPGDSLFEAVRTMLDAEVRHLPIVEDGVHSGVISARDALAAFAADAASRAAAAPTARATGARGTATRAAARKPAAKKTSTKPAAKKTSAEKTAARKPAAKSTARKPAAKSTARKPAARTTAARKPAARTTAARKPAARTTAARKPAAKKTSTKKTSTKKTARRR